MEDVKDTESKELVIVFLKQTKEYVLLLAALVAALLYLNYLVEKVPASFYQWKWLILVLLSGILLSLYFFNVRPAIIKRKARELKPTGDPPLDYFTTSPRKDDKYNFFTHGYDDFLDWVSKPRSPLLFLTGESGSGKSSLINAYIIPHLKTRREGIQTNAVLLRTYHNPLDQLVKTLSPHVFNENYDSTAEDAIKMLREAAALLSFNERLLIIFDQFEEFILLHEQRENLNDQGKGSIKDNSHLNKFNQFIHLFLKNPIQNVTILLSYREDYQQLMDQFDFPARNEHINWMQLSPLPFYKAESFLRNCPGLNVPETRLQRVLQEAARHEGGRVVVRPIVANILGMILQRMVGHPSEWKHESDLLRLYVMQGLGKQLPVERARVLREMLTDFHTARPRNIAELSKSSGMDAGSLDIQLQHMAQFGLVRCLDKEEQKTEKRKWQIAHDFLAVLIERVVHGVRYPTWQTLRPWIAPGLIAILFLTTSFFYSNRYDVAINALGRAGFHWVEKYNLVMTVELDNEVITNAKLKSIIPYLQYLAPDSIDLSFSDSILNVDELKDIKSLKAVGLRVCENLNNIDGLKELDSLYALDLGKWFMSDKKVDSILSIKEDAQFLITVAQLKKLKRLSLRGRGFQNINSLDSLVNLVEFDLSQCFNLTDISGLKNFTNLYYLRLNDCASLQSINDLKGLINLTELNLSNCKRLKDMSTLQELKKLKSLNISYCDSITDFNFLSSLTNLETIGLNYTGTLSIIETLKGLKSLKEVKVYYPDSITNEMRSSFVKALPQKIKVETLKKKG